MLQSVKDPKGKTTAFKYDALGRRTTKINLAKKEINRYIYDGNVLLHEFSYPLEDKPKTIADELGRLSLNREENTSNLTTWVFDEGSFVPQAKIENGETYSIISDYIGKPINAFDSNGKEVWSADYDIYGNIKNHTGNKFFIPFRNQGQYEDEGLNGLMYNRHRYYDGDMGIYISKDPLDLLGGMPNMYSYVSDSNSTFDPFGLFDWKGHLEKISGTKSPPGMQNPHAHHIVFKKGHANQQAILKESKAILEKHNIDWLKGKENLTWAPNKNHSKKAAQRVLDALREADKKGTKEAIVDALDEMGKKFANDTICK